MFWLPSACRLARPMPPQPMNARLTRSFAEILRDLPYEPEGRIRNAAAAAELVLRNSRRGSDCLDMGLPLFVAGVQLYHFATAEGSDNRAGLADAVVRMTGGVLFADDQHRG